MSHAASPAFGAPVKPLSVTEARFYLYTTLFVAGNIALPALCHLVPGGGPMLLPIYFFTLVAGWRFGLAAGLATAVLSPLGNHLLTGMPHQALLPVILAKSVLLAVIASFVARRFGLSLVAVAIAVLGYQVAGGAVEGFLAASLAAALADFRVGLPGIVLQVFGGYAVLRLLARGDRN
jgi:thiamine transporter ThiT